MLESIKNHDAEIAELKKKVAQLHLTIEEYMARVQEANAHV